MRNRIQLYEKAIQELEEVQLKKVSLMSLEQKMNIGVEILLFTGMITAIYFLIELTPALF